MTVNTLDTVACHFCKTTLSADDAYHAGWVAYFWDGDTLVEEPVCNGCAVTHLRVDAATTEYVKVDDGKPPAEVVEAAVAVVEHVDGVREREGKQERSVRCHCCGNDFWSSKPQDPQRDEGFGTCKRCHDWTLGRTNPSPEQRNAAEERFARFA